MSGVHRFLSRREKKTASPQHHNPANPTKAISKPNHFGGVFALPDHDSRKHHHHHNDVEKKKVVAVLERLRHFGIDTMVESNVEYALHSPSVNGDSDAAFRLLMLLQETYEGIVKPYHPETKMLGAQNRDAVTCYLDALLFAMFARLDSFEAMLYDSFEDIPRKRLAGLLRLWVNMLRTGRLITTDITKHLQDSLAECGWEDAARLKQQDPSEAFTFITGQLGLPLLTLKMDLYHTGREEPSDDHKFVNERLLEVAILDEPQDGSDVITLEHCLEHYFNNRIEVKRHMNERRNTLTKDQPPDLYPVEKESGLHVEVAETSYQPDTPILSQSPTAMQTLQVDTSQEEASAPSKNPIEKLRPGSRKRGDSIFSQRKLELIGIDPTKTNESTTTVDSKGRKLSTRTEVLMPAWQFFKLLPWYTDHLPMSDAQVAAHFSTLRPILGICLKRYSYTNTGQAQRLDKYVDIPLEIAVPNFVSDDSMQDDGPLVGNFRLMLQSVVCHRGMSVNSGHYICLTRGSATNAHAHHRDSMGDRSGSDDASDMEDPWMRFDDLAPQRVTYVDIQQALKQEMPYLLFYQVQPIGDDGQSVDDLPSYAEATSSSQAQDTVFTPDEKPYAHNPAPGSQNSLFASTSNHLSVGSEATDFAQQPGSARNSSEIAPRGRSSFSAVESEGRRPSISFDPSSNNRGSAQSTSYSSFSVPTTPSEEKPNSFLAVANKIGTRRGSRQSKAASRTSSAGPANTLSADNSSWSNSRFSLKDLNMTKLTQRMSKGDVSTSSSAMEVTSPPAGPRAPSEASDITAGQLSSDENGSHESIAAIPNAASKPMPIPAAGQAPTNVTAMPLPPVPAPASAPAHHKIRKDKSTVREGKKKKHHDDRDCVVM